jgi:hypothetical protein
LVLAPLILASLAAGCWSGRGPSAGATDASGSDLGSSACNALTAGAVVVQSTESGIWPAPSPTGGALTDGTYHLASTVYYPAAGSGCAGVGVSTGLTITSAAASTTTGTVQLASTTGAGDFTTESASYTINGTSLSLRFDCVFPDAYHLRGNSAQLAYSATATAIQLYGSSAACGDRIDTYDLD